MISVDDYNENNIQLATLIKKYGLEKDTWFAIQLNTIDSHEQVEQLHRMGFNLASHTLTHAFLTEIPLADAYCEMKDSKDMLEKITGKKIDWLILPRGRGNDDIYRMAIEIGYKYIRTTKIQDEQNYLYPELHNRIKGGNHLSYPRKEYNGVDPFEWAKKSSLNHSWLHCFELDKFDLWDKFEQFLIWYKK